MPSLRTYDLFISHAWDYNSPYYRLVDKLNAAPNFSWRNYSVPEHDPLDRSGLAAAISEQIRQATVVLVFAGMYANHREWIQFEIEEARRFGKPIVAIKPWGAERTPAELKDVANETVAWNTSSIIDAIRRVSRR